MIRMQAGFLRRNKTGTLVAAAVMLTLSACGNDEGPPPVVADTLLALACWAWGLSAAE